MFMFVEDESKDVALAAFTLSRLGAKGSSVFDSAPRAIDRLREIREGKSPKPDAVIVDLTLRRGSGQDVLAEMRSHEELRDIPAIVWTRSADTDQHRICRTLGAREVLIKSKSGKELYAAITRVKHAC